MWESEMEQQERQRGFAALVELLEARAALESCTAYLAAQKATQSHRAQLTEPLGCFVNRDVDYQFEQDAKFHLVLADIAANAHLKRELERLIHEVAECSRRCKVQPPQVDDQAATHHWNVMVAVFANDPDRAEAAMRTHMRYIVGLYHQDMKKKGGFQALPNKDA